MRYRVKHSTTYAYQENVSLCLNELHLAPRSGQRQTCLLTNLQVSPRPAISAERRDYFGNHVMFISIQERHQKLEIISSSTVEVLPFTPPMPAVTPCWEDVRDALANGVHPEHFNALQFVHDSRHAMSDPELAEYALQSFTPRRPILEAVSDLTHRVHEDFKYDQGATSLTTSVKEVFSMRKGVCQDFAHLQIACLRSLGLAARYVSGYLLTEPPPGEKRLIGADASHAWLSFYCTGFGWVDVDPTNDCIPSDKHVLVAWGRDYADVSPIKGVILGGGEHVLSVSVDIQPASA
jgi:transglutaminase-like putative cysteine protease